MNISSTYMAIKHLSIMFHISKNTVNKRAKMALDRSPEFLRLPLPFFLTLSEKNLQEFLYVCTVQVAPIHSYHVY